MVNQKFNVEMYPKTFCYVIENDTFNIRCNRCGNVVLKETNKTKENYPYQCLCCDENLYESETYIGDFHSDEELDDLFCDTRDLLLLDN